MEKNIDISIIVIDNNLKVVKVFLKMDILIGRNQMKHAVEYGDKIRFEA